MLKSINLTREFVSLDSGLQGTKLNKFISDNDFENYQSNLLENMK